MQMRQGVSPSLSADVAAVSPVPVQMWAGRAQYIARTASWFNGFPYSGASCCAPVYRDAAAAQPRCAGGFCTCHFASICVIFVYVYHT